MFIRSCDNVRWFVSLGRANRKPDLNFRIPILRRQAGLDMELFKEYIADLLEKRRREEKTSSIVKGP